MGLGLTFAITLIDPADGPSCPRPRLPPPATEEITLDIMHPADVVWAANSGIRRTGCCLYLIDDLAHPG